MVINDPIVKRLQVLRRIIAVSAAVVIGGFVALYVVKHFLHPIDVQTVSNWVSILLFLMLFVLIAFFSTIYSSYMLDNMVKQYTTAVYDGVPGRIATEQPRISHDVTPLPIMLSVRENLSYITFIMFITCFSFLYLIFISTAFSFARFQSSSPLLYVLVGSFIIAVIGTLGFFAVRNSRQRIEITEEGIKGVALGQETFLQWDEIRLFALSGAKNQYTYYYEIVGAGRIIRWIRPLKKGLFMPVVSTVPFKEYDKQVQFALSVIATKTNLPLYDLRLNWYGGIRK